MSYIVFSNLVDLTTAATPSNGFLVAYDLDGTLKQKNIYGTISNIASGGGSTGSLSQVLAIGNTTGINDIVIASGSALITDFGSGHIHFGLDTNSHVYLSSDNGLNQESLIDLANNKISIKSSGNTRSINLGVAQSYSPNDYQEISIIENTFLPSSVDSSDRNSIFIGTKNSSFAAGVSNSVIIGGSSLSATQSNTVYLGNTVNINGAFRLPNIDGSSGQTLKTDGFGNVTWQNDATASTPSLSQVLQVGNITGNNDIIVTSGQLLRSATGSGRLDLGTTQNIVNLSDGIGDFISISQNLISIGVTSSNSTQSNIDIGIYRDDIRVSSNLTFSATSSNSNKNPVFIGTRNSSFGQGITNSVIIGGSNINATESNTLYTSNLQLQGDVLAKYTVQPSSQPGWDALSIPTKAYVDSQVTLGVTGSGSASYIPKWSGTTALSATSSIIDSGGTVSVLTNMSINGVYAGIGRSGIATNTAFGFESINSSTSSGFNNTAIGNRALRQNGSGYDNTAVGLGAMQLNVTGYRNTAVGVTSLRTNSTGYQNISIGWESMFNNTTSNDNISIGVQTMYANTTGSLNVSIGNQSLISNTSGSYNVGLGYQSLNKNTSGSYNISLGGLSMFFNLTGQYNVALGFQTMYNSHGSNNTAIGSLALVQATTVSNTSILGHQSLRNVTTGNNNSAIGAFSGYDTTTGENNTFLGYNTGRTLTTGNNNTFVGANINVSAGTTGSIFISDGSGNIRIMSDDTGKVGINTTTPYAILDINGDFATRHKIVANVSGTLNDYSTLDTSFIVFQNTSASPVYITGFDNSCRGKRLTISNIGPDPIIIQHNNSGSLVANRILTGNSGTDLTLLDNQSAEFIYDTIENIWRLTASTFETSGLPGPTGSTGPAGPAFSATFSNGLTEIVSGVYGLGGTLSQSTFIDADTYNFSIGNANDISLTSSTINLGASVTINGAYTLPNTDGLSGYVLTTDGAGAVTWQAASGGSASNQTLSQVLSLGNSTGTNDIILNNSQILKSPAVTGSRLGFGVLGDEFIFSNDGGALSQARIILGNVNSEFGNTYSLWNGSSSGLVIDNWFKTELKIANITKLEINSLGLSASYFTSKELNVYGTFSLTNGSQANNYILTSDGSGVASWTSSSSLQITKKETDIRNFTASVVETISHNLDTTNVIVQSYDNTGLQIIPGTIQVTGTGSIDITISSTLTNVKTIIIG